MRERNFAVEIVKFIAVFLIINSHADVMYPRFSVLATGGAIGDALFLFVSGFTLFLSSQRRFDNYYKRRINRIYPSVIMAAIFCMLINFNSGVNILRNWGGNLLWRL
jgi:peptidoglycan/LPS O-acetylase OafA/YrhL